MLVLQEVMTSFKVGGMIDGKARMFFVIRLAINHKIDLLLEL